MREFVVSEAPRDRVAALTRTTVEDVGGVVAQATERTTEFDHLEPAAGDWSRSGYVGTYKRYGEPPVRLRIRVWAEWPRKLFLWSVFLGLVQSVLFFSLALVGLSPPSNVWIFSAIITFALIAIGLLMYTSSWADSREIEDEIARRLTARLADDEEVPGDVYTLGEWEAYRARVIDGVVEKAEPVAPQRPSRTERVLERVGISSGEEDDAEADELDREPAVEAEPDDDEEIEDDESEEGDEDSSLLDRVAVWRSSEDDEDEPDEEPEQEPDQEPAAETEPDEAEEDPDEETEDEADDEDGVLDRLAFWRSSEDDDEEEPDEADDAEEEEAPDEEALEAEDEAEPDDEDAEDEADEGSGLLDRVAFWKGSDDDVEPGDEADDEDGGASDDGADDEDPEVAEKRKRLEELKRKKEAAEADDSS